MHLVDGIYTEAVDDSATIARGLTAGGGPLYPPTDWFKNPGFDRPTPITVTADGQIKGHIAAWETDHIGLPNGQKPPRSNANYAFFRTGVLQTQEGEEVPVGQLTLAGGHAPINASAGEAVKHYDDTASSVADLAVGEDEHGIWVSGAVRPGVTEEQIRALRASAPSGDWRPINGALELVAVCQVNTPGFPVARAMVASGEVTALVAAGASYMYGLQQDASVMEHVTRLSSRVDHLESVVAAAPAAVIEPETASAVEDAVDEAAEIDAAVSDDDEPEVSDLRARRLEELDEEERRVFGETADETLDRVRAGKDGEEVQTDDETEEEEVESEAARRTRLIEEMKRQRRVEKLRQRALGA